MMMKQYVSTPTPSERNRTAAPCRWASESEQARIHSTTKQYNRVASFENLKFNVTRVPGHLDTSMHQPEVGTLVLHADLPIFTREKEECWMGRGKLVLVHTSSHAHGSSLHTPLPSTRAQPHLRLTQFCSKRHWSRSCTCPLNAALISFTQHRSGSLNHPRLVS